MESILRDMLDLWQEALSGGISPNEVVFSMNRSG
jgi:hypothetical protein